VVFHPASKDISVSGGSADPSAPSRRIGQKAVNSAQYDSIVNIDDLSINLMDYGASDEARVRFFPNGTCDELRLILDANGEYRVITLEPTTSLAYVGSLK
jgi:hypothetical protein